MSRWEPDARGRLQQAALDLFVERGYDDTTVEDIAVRAGLTKRTFFRHFPDKREVLSGGDGFTRLVLGSLAAVPATAAPMDALASALDAVGAALDDDREAARRRRGVIAAHPELQERELAKLAAVAVALAGALRERGVTEPAATVAAEAAVAVFRVAFDRWATGDDPGALRGAVRDAFDALRSLDAGGPARTSSG